MKIFFMTFFLSSTITLVLIFLGNKYSIWVDITSKSHAVHTLPTPKSGGLSIYVSSFIIIFLFFNFYYAIYLLLSSSLLFFYGLYEDSNGDTPQYVRLIVMTISGLMTIYFTNIYVYDIGFITLPRALGIIFTLFCVVGIASAINFIDGLNGLSTGICLITLLFYGLICFQLNDIKLFTFILILFSAILGFFIFNYPFGKIFLGDGGAYFLGFIMAFLSILLANRHYEVISWYPLLSLSYPVIETIITIIRRIYKRRVKNIPFFQSERLHLHSLLFKRKTRNNPVASFYLLCFHFFINVFAYFLKSNLSLLILLFTIVWLVYLICYKHMFIKISNGR